MERLAIEKSIIWHTFVSNNLLLPCSATQCYSLNILFSILYLWPFITTSEPIDFSFKQVDLRYKMTLLINTNIQRKFFIIFKQLRILTIWKLDFVDKTTIIKLTWILSSKTKAEDEGYHWRCDTKENSNTSYEIYRIEDIESLWKIDKIVICDSFGLLVILLLRPTNFLTNGYVLGCIW